MSERLNHILEFVTDAIIGVTPEHHIKNIEAANNYYWDLMFRLGKGENITYQQIHESTKIIRKVIGERMRV